MDQICITVMMVINLKHLESSRPEAVSVRCFKLLHSGAYCPPGNVMTARRATDRALHMEKYYLCERSIKDGLRGDQGPSYFTSAAILFPQHQMNTINMRLYIFCCYKIHNVTSSL